MRVEAADVLGVEESNGSGAVPLVADAGCPLGTDGTDKLPVASSPDVDEPYGGNRRPAASEIAVRSNWIILVRWPRALTISVQC